MICQGVLPGLEGVPSASASSYPPGKWGLTSQAMSYPRPAPAFQCGNMTGGAPGARGGEEISSRGAVSRL